MTVAVPISAEQRDRIVALAQDGMPRNAIAREVGVSGTTVKKYAEAAGYSFDRSSTRKAAEAAQIDNAVRREALATKILTKLDAAVEAIDVTQITAGAREMDRVLRSLAAASRSFSDATKASPLRDTSNDEVVTALREFRNDLAESVEMQLRLEAYEARYGTLDDIPDNDYGRPEHQERS
ncbi:helix-turn-helix domain-containing protein [Microbacterium sp. NPDC087589]|uniref:helix-turn-helix domain-containing protein n=1 Tax=Microbacterium sp. NPDC087589 TaxID=3364191 RepID=UPI003828E388